MYLLGLCFLVVGVAGQISVPGTCNLVGLSSVTNLNISQISGLWNQIKRIDNLYESGDCSTLKIDVRNEGNTVDFTLKELVNKTEHIITGNIIPFAVGVFAFNISNEILPFVVLSTNYNGYAILYSCYSVNTTSKSVWSWQYNRKTSLSSTDQSAVDSIIANYADLKNATWRVTSRDACGGAGVALAAPYLLFILSILVLGKEFV